MANVTGVLGHSGTNNSFVTNTRVWAGGVDPSTVEDWNPATDYTTASLVLGPGFPSTAYYSPSQDITGDAGNTFVLPRFFQMELSQLTTLAIFVIRWNTGNAAFFQQSPAGQTITSGDVVILFHNTGALFGAFEYSGADNLFGSGGLAEGDFTATAAWYNSSGLFTNSEPYLTASGDTATAESSTVVTNQLQVSGAATGGTQIFNDTDIQWAVTGGATAGGGTSNTSRTLRRSRIILDRTAYTLLGNWQERGTGGVDNPTWVIDDFEMSGLVDEAIAAVGASIFTGAINTTNSSFSGVNFWNNVALGSGARGGVWQTTSGAVYNNSLLGPFGNQLNSAANDRMIARFGNQGNNSLTQANHTGFAPNYDFRSLSQITPSLGITATKWFIDIDTGAHMAFLNWLPGTPTGVDDWGFTSYFNNGTNPGGQAHVLVGTNQNPGDGDHIYTLTDADIDAGVFLLDGSWDINTSLSAADGSKSSVWLEDDDTESTFARFLLNPTGGLVWRNQHYNQATLTSGNTTPTAITALSAKTYRKYSWRQQPSDSTWGREVSVAVPQDGATPEQLATARAGGYDEHNGTTWLTNTDTSDALDLICNETALDTPAKAATFASTTGASNGSHLVAMAKSLAWAETQVNANIGTANTRIPLQYSFSGTTLDFTNNLTLGAVASTRTNTSGAYSYNLRLNTTDAAIIPNDFVTAISANSITISTPITGATNVDLESDTSITVSAGVSNIDLKAATMSVPFGNLQGDIVYNAATDGGTLVITFSGLVADTTYNLNQLLGIRFTINDNIRIESDVDVNVETSLASVTGGTANGTVTKISAPITFDFSSYISEDANWLSDAKMSYRGVGSSAAPTAVTLQTLTEIGPPNLLLNSSYTFVVTKPGWSNYRSADITYLGEETIVPILTIDAAVEDRGTTPDADITTVTPTVSGDAVTYTISGANAGTNALSGTETSWLIEQIKSTQEYANAVVIHGNTALTLTHSSPQITSINGQYLKFTPVTGFSQQLTGLVGSTSTAFIVNNGDFTIFVNQSSEVSYGEIRNIVSSELLPVESNQERITENQRGLETAIRRGAVKAAAYSSEDVKLTTDS